MSGARRPAGLILIAVGALVAIYFVVNPFLAEKTSIDVQAVWAWLDVLMAIGLVIALALNFVDKGEAGRRDENGQTDLRRYLSVNVVFYMTAVIAILFLHSWFSSLANGPDWLDGNHSAWVIWAIVDTILPLVFIVTGIRQLRT